MEQAEEDSQLMRLGKTVLTANSGKTRQLLILDFVPSSAHW